MAVIVKPNITVDNIVLEANINDKDNIDLMINEIGKSVPLVKIGDYVLNLSDTKEFTFGNRLNSLPIFSLTVNDEQYFIREALKNKIDKCVIFMGYKHWYIKFNGILDTEFSEVGDSHIELSGTLYNEKLYNVRQYSYKDKTIEDILKDICTQTSMGLFTFQNEFLSKQIDYSLMTGTRYIDYFDFIIQTYTNNFYMIDSHYFYHVGNIDAIRKQKYDKYSLNWKTGEQISETDIIFKSIVRNVDDTKDITADLKIPIEYYTFTTNFSQIYKETYAEYEIGFGGNGNTKISSNNSIGIGSNKTNSFNGFKSHKNPFYKDLINKQIGGNLIKIFSENVLFELSPFSVVGLEIYLPYRNGTDIRLDEEHSGKKVVLGSTIKFKKLSSTINKLSQEIELI